MNIQTYAAASILFIIILKSAFIALLSCPSLFIHYMAEEKKIEKIHNGIKNENNYWKHKINKGSMTS